MVLLIMVKKKCYFCFLTVGEPYSGDGATVPVRVEPVAPQEQMRRRGEARARRHYAAATRRRGDTM